MVNLCIRRYIATAGIVIENMSLYLGNVSIATNCTSVPERANCYSVIYFGNKCEESGEGYLSESDLFSGRKLNGQLVRSRIVQFLVQ